MNANRRKQLDKLYERLEDIRADLQAVMDEEEEALSNLPENMQDGEKGQKMQEAIDNLDYALNSMDEVMDYITSAIE